MLVAALEAVVLASDALWPLRAVNKGHQGGKRTPFLSKIENLLDVQIIVVQTLGSSKDLLLVCFYLFLSR